MRVDVAKRVAVVLVALGLGAASVGCSSDGSRGAGPTTATPTTETLPVGLEADGARVTATADGRGAVALRVPGVAAIEGGPGSVRPSGTVVAAPASVEAPPDEIGGLAITSIGPGVWVDAGRVREPLAVTFPEAAAPTGQVLVAVHRGDGGAWTLLPDVTRAGPGGLRVRTDEFSFVSWATTSVLRPVGDFLAEKLAGRSEPSVCQQGPGWADVTGNPSGSTHSCVRAGKPLADGTEIAELEIKSNRGTYQWVQIPANAREYVWVENQSDLVRALITRLFGSATTVLLPPGKRMTVGYRQPVSPDQFAFHTYVDNRSAVLSMAHLVFDAMIDGAVDSAGGWVVVASCFGAVNLDPRNLDDPVGLQWPDLFESVPKCLHDRIAEFEKDPEKAAAVAEELLGGPGKVNPDQLTEVTQTLYKAGKFAAVIGRVISLCSYVLKELAFLGDALAAGIGADNATDVTLTLGAKPPPSTPRDADLGLAAVEPPGLELRNVLMASGSPVFVPLDDGARCYSIEVLGWQPSTRSADVLVHYNADAIGYDGQECGGDALGTFVRIRDGKAVDELSASGDVDLGTESEIAAYKAAVDAYRGHEALDLQLGNTETGWYVESVTRERFLEPAAPQACTRTITTEFGETVSVKVSSGGLSCDAAAAVVEKYLNDPSVDKQGSSGQASFDGWACYASAMRDENGALGKCTGNGAVIELR